MNSSIWDHQLLVIVDVELSVAEIVITVGLSYLPDRTARIAISEHIVGNVLSYNASAAYDDVIANRNSGTYQNIAADPYILTDSDIDTVFISRIA